MKISVFFKFPNGEFVEYQTKINVQKAKEDIAKDEHFEPSYFDIFCHKVNELVKSDYYKDAQLIASSFGPLNVNEL